MVPRYTGTSGVLPVSNFPCHLCLRVSSNDWGNKPVFADFLRLSLGSFFPFFGSGATLEPVWLGAVFMVSVDPPLTRLEAR